MPDASLRRYSRALFLFAFALSCAPPATVDRGRSIGVAADAGGEPLDGGSGPDIGGGTVLPDAGPDVILVVGTEPAGGGAPPAIAPPEGGSAPGASLVATFADPGIAITDLASAGPLDWVHCGFQGTKDINRKRGVPAPLIVTSSFGPDFTGRSSGDFAHFVWSDGSPVSSARNVQSGFETGNAAAGGFQVEVQGDPERSRTVKLFVGAARGGAILTARFGGAGPPIYVDATLTADSLVRNRVYTLDFRPAVAGRTLVLEWTIDATGGRQGNVRLQAVTLAESPPGGR
jgi:hypothetical protein